MTTQEYVEWLAGPLLSGLYPTEYYNGDPIPPSRDGYILNYLVCLSVSLALFHTIAFSPLHCSALWEACSCGSCVWGTKAASRGATQSLGVGTTHWMGPALRRSSTPSGTTSCGPRARRRRSHMDHQVVFESMLCVCPLVTYVLALCVCVCRRSKQVHVLDWPGDAVGQVQLWPLLLWTGRLRCVPPRHWPGECY